MTFDAFHILGFTSANSQNVYQLTPSSLTHNPPRPFEPDEIKVESPTAGGIMKQQLNPVAMPGSFGTSPRLSQNLMNPVLSMPSSSLPSSSMGAGISAGNAGAAPKVPVRSPHKSSLLQSNMPSVPSRQVRPVSDLSMMSDFTQCDTASVTTRQSVNEILSLADVPMVNDINLDNLDFDFYMQEPTLVKQEEQQQQPCSSTISTIKQEPVRKPSVDYMGSLSSVATVRENKANSAVVQPLEEPSSSTNLIDDNLEINQIYDDVMQCVYDDVDTKYDDVEMLEPPVPPMRKRGLSVDHGVQGIDKPLPVAPKNPSIITKLSEKKNELLKEREKELERKKLIEEQKRKEKEALEEQKRKEKEEKEKKRLEEKERKRLEEEEKKLKKKKEEEEKKSSKNTESDADKVDQSLFQRLFQRNKSRLEEESNSSTGKLGADYSLDTPPPVPAHASTTSEQVLPSAGEQPPPAQAADASADVHAEKQLTATSLSDGNPFTFETNISDLEQDLEELITQVNC